MYFWLMKSTESTVNLRISLKPTDLREIRRFTVDSVDLQTRIHSKSVDTVDFRIRRFNLNLQISSEINIYLSDINRETSNVSITKDYLPRKVTPMFSLFQLIYYFYCACHGN